MLDAGIVRFHVLNQLLWTEWFLASGVNHLLVAATWTHNHHIRKRETVWSPFECWLLQRVFVFSKDRNPGWIEFWAIHLNLGCRKYYFPYFDWSGKGGCHPCFEFCHFGVPISKAVWAAFDTCDWCTKEAVITGLALQLTSVRLHPQPPTGIWVSATAPTAQRILPTCIKFTLKQERKKNSNLSNGETFFELRFITWFHNLLLDSSWLYKVWSLLD